MTDPTRLTAEQLGACRMSITDLRDAARSGGMDFKIRDKHVVLLHELVDAYDALRTELARKQSSFQELLDEFSSTQEQWRELQARLETELAQAQQRGDGAERQRDMLAEELTALRARLTDENINHIWSEAEREWGKHAQYRSDFEFDIWLTKYLAQRLTDAPAPTETK